MADAFKCAIVPLMSDAKPQIDKFKDAARGLECDDDEKRFKERLGKLVKKRGGEAGKG